MTTASGVFSSTLAFTSNASSSHSSINLSLALGEDIFSYGHATLHLAVSVRPSVRPSVTFLNCERFSHYRSCPTVRDWIAVYPALFFFKPECEFKRIKSYFFLDESL